MPPPRSTPSRNTGHSGRLWLSHTDYLIDPHILQDLTRSARPPDLDPRDRARRTEPEVHTEIAGRSIAHRGGHVVHLGADPHLCADPVAIASRTPEAQNKPGI